MFEFGFGLVWLVLVAMFTIVFLISATFSGAPIYIPIFLILFLSLFWYVGIYLIVKGYKKIKANKETNLYGELCYAVISNIYESGAYVNNNPEYKADFLVYIYSRGEVELVSEVVGFDYTQYKIGTCVKVKYYNGDINIESVEPKDSLPYDVEAEIQKYKEHYNINLPSDDAIIIDGVEYVRKDSINNINSSINDDVNNNIDNSINNNNF